MAVSEKNPVNGEASMEEIWAAASRDFERVCGMSLKNGDVKSFDDVQRRIERSGNAETEDNWDAAKSLGLKSLKFLKTLVGAASQASSLIPIPSAAANITGTALCFVFDIPKAIKGYKDAIDQVFSEVSSALAQFQIYRSMDNVDPLLIKQIHLVLISFVNVCAHVVKYRQGRRRDRLVHHVRSIFEDDSGLADQMADFKRALQAQRDVEGTVTLAVAVETQQGITLVLEKFIIFGKITEETHQAVQETQKGVQALTEDLDRIKTLVKIRDNLGVESTVRLDTNTTQTCTNILNKCLAGTGSWIWTHDAYIAWTSTKEEDASHVMIVSGPQSSGKTYISALITNRLEEQRGRTYVAHYFFPPSTKKSDNNPVQFALKYMAFQIARVDVTVQKALGKACDAGSATFGRSVSSENLDLLLTELKIGVPGSGATYYLVFDGLENLPGKQAEMLLKSAFSARLAGDSTRRVRILLSGTNTCFSDEISDSNKLRIQMEDQNGPDMRIVIDEALNKQGMLQNGKNIFEQQKARQKIINKLPQNVSASYSLLQFGLDRVIRLLSMRTAAQELDQMLEQPVSSHEASIKNLQQSLTVGEIAELNELLKWVIYGASSLTLDQLEAAMLLYTGIESLTSLEYIVKTKYQPVLKIEDGYVEAQHGVRKYLQERKCSSIRSSDSKDRATISMTITINKVDQDLCGHFLWDLADMAIRDKFKFNLNGDSLNAVGTNNVQNAVVLDEFEANHSIVVQAFKYLSKEPLEQTKDIGQYLLLRLPYHLNQLRKLEDDDQGALTPHQRLEIGQNLYKLFKDDVLVQRHKATFQQSCWTAADIMDVQKWMSDTAVTRRLDRKWQDKLQAAVNPTKGYLEELVRVVVQGLLKDRTWEVSSACIWLKEFIAVDEKKDQQPQKSAATDGDDASDSTLYTRSPSSPSNKLTNWDHVSTWCQKKLGLSESQLDSLWYERLAEASYLQNNDLDMTLSLYQRAIQHTDPSWLCRRGLGNVYYRQGRMDQAIAEIEQALGEAQREASMPKPKLRDITELHLLIGKIAYEAGYLSKAAASYSAASLSNDTTQALMGHLGHLKAMLKSTDAEKTREVLKLLLADKDTKGRSISILKMLSRDYNHDALASIMFVRASEDPELLREIVRTMQTATTKILRLEDHSTDTLESDDSYAEDEARGVLLYDLGVAAYTYKICPDGTEPTNEAVRLWTESRDQLAKVGGRNAVVARSNAASALANHYFQSMVDNTSMVHFEALAKLVQNDSIVYNDDAVGFLGATHALRGNKEQARAVLVRQVKQALQILSDDMPENDTLGFSILHKTMEKYQDFRNAVVALSLVGQADFVTEALYFNVDDIDGESVENKYQVLTIVQKLAEETIRVAKTQVPDSAMQLQRIAVAKAHVDSFSASVQTEIKSEGDGDFHREIKEPSAPDSNPVTGNAHRLIKSRLLELKQLHTPELNFAAFWSCNGRTSDGKQCRNVANLSREFYHCTYCSNRDFCGECLPRLRDPACNLITVCSAKHRWLRVPRQGDDVYVGLKAKSVRMPSSVKAMDGDEQIIMAYYAEDGVEEQITIETWKRRIADEWGVSLQEMNNDIPNLATPKDKHEG